MPTDYYDRPYELVKDQIDAMAGRADQALAASEDAVTALSTIPSPTLGVIPPNLQLPPDLPDNTPDPRAPTRPTYFPAASMSIPDVTNTPVDGLFDPGDIPAFDPPAITLNIPNAPAPIDTSGLPDAPTLDGITIPTAPAITEPELGNLLQIVIPTFEGLNLPTFDAIAPEFAELAPASLNFTEPIYVSANLDAIKARVATMLAGGTGLTPAVEQALFDRTIDRIDADAVKARSEGFAAWAGRGFDMPPGMLVEQDNASIEAGRIQVNSAGRDILLQAATWEIENLRFAVTNGISLETQLMGLFNNEAQRVFESARARVEADTAIYNAKVQLFTALNSAYATKAQVFSELIRGELAKLEAFKAEIEAQQAIGQVNEQTVRVYQAQLQGVANLIEVYKAQVTGAQAFIEAQKNKVELYGEGVRAYAARIDADKTRFDAYKTQIEGETAKENLLDVAARAFAATIEGYKAKASIFADNSRVRIETLNSDTQRFAALVAAERDRVAADTDVVRSMVAAFQGDVSLYVAQLDDKTKLKGLNISKQEAAVRNAIAAYEVIVKEYDAALGRLEQESEVRVKALETIATVTSQLAAGAFAAMHVSAQMEGRADVSDNLQTTQYYPHIPT